MLSTGCAQGGITTSSEIARCFICLEGAFDVEVSSCTNDFTFGAIFCRQSLFFLAAEVQTRPIRRHSNPALSTDRLANRASRACSDIFWSDISRSDISRADIPCSDIPCPDISCPDVPWSDISCSDISRPHASSVASRRVGRAKGVGPATRAAKQIQ